MRAVGPVVFVVAGIDRCDSSNSAAFTTFLRLVAFVFLPPADCDALADAAIETPAPVEDTDAAEWVSHS